MDREDLTIVYREQSADELRGYLKQDEGIFDVISAEYRTLHPELDEGLAFEGEPGDGPPEEWVRIQKSVERMVVLATLKGIMDVLEEVFAE